MMFETSDKHIICTSNVASAANTTSMPSTQERCADQEADAIKMLEEREADLKK